MPVTPKKAKIKAKSNLIMLESFTTWLSHSLSSLSYLDIFILMTLENSFLPIPSEIILLPAGYLAAAGKISLWGAITASTVGTVLGATINYYLALHLGRRVIHRFARQSWAKWFMLDEERLTKAEDYYRANGKVSTLIGRCVPVVRQFISLPAGLAKMNIWHFLLYTTLGSTLWSTLLALIGYWFGAYQSLIVAYLNKISNITLIVLVSAFVYIIIKNVRK